MPGMGGGETPCRSAARYRPLRPRPPRAPDPLAGDRPDALTESAGRERRQRSLPRSASTSVRREERLPSISPRLVAVTLIPAGPIEASPNASGRLDDADRRCGLLHGHRLHEAPPPSASNRHFCCGGDDRCNVLHWCAADSANCDLRSKRLDLNRRNEQTGEVDQ